VTSANLHRDQRRVIILLSIPQSVLPLGVLEAGRTANEFEVFWPRLT
jgi:hypothetical protein